MTGTRNIAIKISELDSEHDSASDPGKADLRNYPFSRYIHDRGYQVSDLKSILYYSAKNDPGYFYLASVNGDFGKSPVTQAAFSCWRPCFPFFPGNGKFVPEVFERNRKTDIDAFIERYKNNYIHLVKIKADTAFILPETSN